MIDKHKETQEMDERMRGMLACLDMAAVLEHKLAPALPEGWEIQYDAWSEWFAVSNRAEPKDLKSIDEFMLVTRLVNQAAGRRSQISEVKGKAEDFSITRQWKVESEAPGIWGYFTVELRIRNPKDCRPHVKREMITTEVQTLSLGDVCLGFKED